MTATDCARLWDLEEIKKLRILYSHYLDTHELEKLTSLFTEDAVCDFGRGGAWKGHDALRRGFAEAHAQYDTNRTGTYPYLHAITNHWIELTGPDSAEGRCYLLDWVTAHVDRNPLLLLGIYADVYRKDAGVWRFSRCRIDFIWPNRDIVGGVPGQQRASEN
jgi:hypothetical protein